MEFLDLRSYCPLLVITPHPDDEVLGCGGTVIAARNLGLESHVVYVTDGDAIHGGHSDEIAGKRRKEATAVSEFLGFSRRFFLGFPDGEISQYEEEISESLRSIIEEIKPGLVLAPSPADYHPDHIALAGVTGMLFSDSRRFPLAFYEVYTSIRFTHLSEITDVFNEKERAIRMYTLSLYGKPDLFVHSIRGLNAHKSIFTHNAGYYEGFLILDPQKDDIEDLRRIVLY